MKALAILFAIFFCTEAVAQETRPEIPDILDVDRRQAYSYRFELSPYAGQYWGDLLETSYLFGGNLQWNLTDRLALATDFGFSRINFDSSSAFGGTVTDRNQFFVDGGFILTLPAAYLGPGGVVETDFFTSIGGGVIQTNGSWRGGGYIGGGMKIRPKIRWLAVRVELRNYFTSIANPSGSDFEDVVTLRVGPTFLIPPEM